MNSLWPIALFAHRNALSPVPIGWNLSAIKNRYLSQIRVAIYFPTDYRGVFFNFEQVQTSYIIANSPLALQFFQCPAERLRTYIKVAGHIRLGHRKM